MGCCIVKHYNVKGAIIIINHYNIKGTIVITNHYNIKGAIVIIDCFFIIPPFAFEVDIIL